MDPSTPNPLVPDEVITPRQAEACRYKRSGYSTAEVAKMMGVSMRAVQALLKQAYKVRSVYDQFDRDEARLQALDQLDLCLHRAMVMVEADGEKERSDGVALAAMDRIVAIHDRKAKLMGLDTGEHAVRDEMPTNRDELIKELRDAARMIKQNGKGLTPSAN